MTIDSLLFQLVSTGAAAAVWLGLNIAINKWDPPGDVTTDVGVKKLCKILLTGSVLLLVAVVWGLPLSSLSVVLGGLSAGLAFAAKDFVSNILSAITLFTDRPFKIGDTISVDGICGKVVDIGVKGTKLQERHSYWYIPNSAFSNQAYEVENQC